MWRSVASLRLASCSRTVGRRSRLLVRPPLLFRSTSAFSSSSSSSNKDFPVQPLSLQRTYRYLDLQTFTAKEFDLVFDRLQVVSSESSSSSSSKGEEDAIDVAQIQHFFEQRIPELEEEDDFDDSNAASNKVGRPIRETAALSHFCAHEARRFLQVFDTTTTNSQRLTRTDFVNGLLDKTSRVDIRRTWPITASMLLVGASVGVITPAMPFVVELLQLTPTQFGSIVSAFALAKMAGNIPAAIAVERHGRKPYMTYSLVVIALGVGGIGWAGTFEELYVCRLLTGLGVAALSTAGTMMMTDLSTPRNRASTMAPIMSAFAAGTALGPALGGYMVDAVGLQSTFQLVGLSYLGVAMLNRAILEETRPQALTFPWQMTTAATTATNTNTNSANTNTNAADGNKASLVTEVENAVGQWVPLARDPKIRNVLIMNAVYWVSLAGSQMTLLPLMLTDANGLAMTATQVGQVYMGMSTIQIVGNPLFARFADRFGKEPAIVGGCTLISSAMAMLPFCCHGNMTHLAACVAVWSVGSSMLSTAPIAYITDRVNPGERAQAIAMLRTCGDVGFLIGASGTGALADWTGSLDFAMQSSAGLLFLATTWFATRQVLTARLKEVEP
jgi:MFS family permease